MGVTSDFDSSLLRIIFEQSAYSILAQVYYLIITIRKFIVIFRRGSGNILSYILGVIPPGPNWMIF